MNSYLDTAQLSASIFTLGCQIIGIIFSFLLLIATITLLLSAFYFMLSGGREEEKDKAKKFFIYSIIGVALAVLSPSVVALIASFFGLPAPVNC